LFEEKANYVLSCKKIIISIVIVNTKTEELTKSQKSFKNNLVFKSRTIKIEFAKEKTISTRHVRKIPMLP